MLEKLCLVQILSSFVVSFPEVRLKQNTWIYNAIPNIVPRAIFPSLSKCAGLKWVCTIVVETRNANFVSDKQKVFLLAIR